MDTMRLKASPAAILRFEQGGVDEQKKIRTRPDDDNRRKDEFQ